MGNSIEAETQSFALSEPGTGTKFIIKSGSAINYEVLIIRSEEVFGVPKYQIFEPPEPVPCPKQKRILTRYGDFWSLYKEFVIGFFVFVLMFLLRMYERSTRPSVDEILMQADGLMAD